MLLSIEHQCLLCIAALQYATLHTVLVMLMHFAGKPGQCRASMAGTTALAVQPAS